MSECGNTLPCTCGCPRRGKRCACVAHRRDHDEGVPGCLFSPAGEVSYDRSIEAPARDHGLIP